MPRLGFLINVRALEGNSLSLQVSVYSGGGEEVGRVDALWSHSNLSL